MVAQDAHAYTQGKYKTRYVRDVRPRRTKDSRTVFLRFRLGTKIRHSSLPSPAAPLAGGPAMVSDTAGTCAP